MGHKKQANWVLLAIGLAVTAVMIAVSGMDTGAVNRARDTVYDGFLRSAPRPYDPAVPVHVVDIDEAALQVYGQWPWPRPYLATLTDKLFDHGAVVVGYDVLFVEPDRTASILGPVPDAGSGAALAAPIAPPDGHDARFAQALQRGPTVLGIAGAPKGVAPEVRAGVSLSGALSQGVLTGYPGALQNLDVLTQAASGIGSVSLGRLDDGIVRTVPAITDIGGQLVPAFALELLRVAQDAGGYVLKTTKASGEVGSGVARPVALRVGGAEIPLSAQGHIRVNYAGSAVRPVTSAASILQTQGIDPALAQAISGKIILVGSSAQALFDIRATPLEEQIPGVFVHAEIIEQVVAGRYITAPDWARGAEVLAIALIGLLVTLALIRDRPLIAVGAAVACGGACFAGASWAFATQGQLLNPVFPILTAFLILIPGASLGILMKERARAAVRARFSYFLPPGLVDEIADDPSATLTPQGAVRDLTILFADMRQFTNLTEKMSPDDVVRYVNVFLGTVSDALVASGGTIDKFMGDAVMAFWNAPIETENHQAAALGAISAVEDAIAQINADLPAQGLPQIDVAIGVNTGPASVGLMGSKDRLSYTCVGDSVTLAARLEGLTRIYGVSNCVSGSTLAHLPDALLGITLDVVAVKGRDAAEPVFTVVGNTPDTRSIAQAVEAARAAYLAQNWDLAASAFQTLSEMSLNGRSLATLAALYLERIDGFRADPPASDWTGTAQATAKR
ncbi:CHASE2 domain-containing protein [Algirhabdus cladophorae]|uniref:CHASE2 domain-containing protein n=1 Tax=Algirhabdus cladophorae TaxID=3377108 RepID=UPI003B84A494